MKLTNGSVLRDAWCVFVRPPGVAEMWDLVSTQVEWEVNDDIFEDILNAWLDENED